MPWMLHLLGDKGQLTAGKNLFADYDKSRDRFAFVSIPHKAEVFKTEAAADKFLKTLPELYHTCWKPVEMTERESSFLDKEPA